jgi:hypothetical protein
MPLSFLASDGNVIDAFRIVPENPPPLGTSLSAASSDAPPAASPKRPRRSRRRLLGLLFVLVAGVSGLLSPAPWHVALRAFLTLGAANAGWNLQIGGIEGGLFDATELYNVRCTQRRPGDSGQPEPAPSTDFQIERAELVIAWRWPWLQRSEGSWISRVAVDGLRGTCDLADCHKQRLAAGGDRPRPADE